MSKFCPSPPLPLPASQSTYDPLNCFAISTEIQLSGGNFAMFRWVLWILKWDFYPIILKPLFCCHKSTSNDASVPNSWGSKVFLDLNSWLLSIHGKNNWEFSSSLYFTSANYFLSHYNTKPERPKRFRESGWACWYKGCSDTHLTLFFSSAHLVAGVLRRNWLTASCVHGCVRWSFFTTFKLHDIFGKDDFIK